MNDVYTENGKVRGRCSVCSGTEVHYQSKSNKYLKPYYFSVFEKQDWFRGNDVYLGKICKDCLDDGRISEVNKQQPAPSTKSLDREGKYDKRHNPSTKAG